MSAAMRSRIAATLVALLQAANTAMVRQIAAAVDPRAPWDAQVGQAIQAWIAVANPIWLSR